MPLSSKKMPLSSRKCQKNPHLAMNKKRLEQKSAMKEKEQKTASTFEPSSLWVPTRADLEDQASHQSPGLWCGSCVLSTKSP